MKSQPNSKSYVFRICLTLIFALVLLLSQPTKRIHAISVVRYVTPNGETSGACTSWETACNLSYALGIAIPENELWVKSGSYKPTSGSDRTYSFALKNGVALYGGFTGTETTQTQRNPTTNITTLSGDIGVPNETSDNSYHVVTAENVNNTAILDGFTIVGGNANSASPHSNGGGLLNATSNPTLRNIIFSNNAAAGRGGGIYNFVSSPDLTNVTFVSNSADQGGGMFNVNANPNLLDVTFLNNITVGGGGGIFNDSSDPIMTNVTFNNNMADYDGGGMCNKESNPILTNVTFINNSAGWGGGMWNLNSAPTLTNLTFTNNSAVQFGGGIHNFASNPTINNSLFWGNSAPTSDRSQVYNTNGSAPVINDSVVQNDCPPGSICTHIITDNPLIGSQGAYGGLTQTIPLLPGSSAIDATSNNCLAIDQRGETRSSPNCDIGAFESSGFLLVIQSGDNQSTAINTQFAYPLQVSLSPFKPSEPVNGGLVTFTAPSSGASVTLDGNPAIIANGTASVTATANDVAATYQVFVSANGASSSAEFNLTNFIPDVIPPNVTSIIRTNSNLSSATSVNFTVTFSEFATGVDVGDFVLTTSGVFGAILNGLSGSGNIYTVTVNTGTGDGTIRLDVVDDDSIIDGVSNPLGGAGAGNGNFTGGETYTIDKTAPTVTMSSAALNPTNSSPIPVTVQFSETVTGFLAGDISLGNGSVGNFVAVDGDTYTFDLTPSAQGLVTADIAASVVTDLAGNGNTIATQFSRTYSVTYNLFLPLILR